MREGDEGIGLRRRRGGSEKSRPFVSETSPLFYPLLCPQSPPKHPRCRVPRDRRAHLYVFPPQADLPGHAVAERQARTRTMDYSTSLVLIFGGCCSSVVFHLFVSSLLMPDIWFPQKCVGIRATPQTNSKYRLRPHFRPNALYHPPILTLFHRMAQIQLGYPLSNFKATPGPHLGLGHSSSSPLDGFPPQQLGFCVRCSANRADRVPFRRYAVARTWLEDQQADLDSSRCRNRHDPRSLYSSA